MTAPDSIEAVAADMEAKAAVLDASTVGPWCDDLRAFAARLRALAPPAAGACATCAALDKLRMDEGNSVEFYCSNPDFNGLPNEKVVVVADWTQWLPREFTGGTLVEALAAAVAAARKEAT